MRINNFDIKILDIHWIQGIDDPADLCAHGHVYVRIGEEVICDGYSLDVTVSTTALYLMRTLTRNYKSNDYASQLLPCCGHFMVVDEKTDLVIICGCSSGIDWTIIHTEDNQVKHTTDNRNEVTIELEDYKTIVFEFADQVENFYKNSLPKTTPEGEVDKKGYLAFWREWRNLRAEWN